jgi:hypothetical protein
MYIPGDCRIRLHDIRRAAGPLTRDGGSAADVSWPGRSDVRLLHGCAWLLAASFQWLSKTGVRIPFRSLVERLPSFAFCAVVSEDVLLYPGPNVDAPLSLSPIVTGVVYSQQRTRLSRLVFHLLLFSIYIISRPAPRSVDFLIKLELSPVAVSFLYLLLPSPLFPTTLATDVRGRGAQLFQPIGYATLLQNVSD